MGLEALLIPGYGELAAIEPGCAGRELVPPSKKGLVAGFAVSGAEAATFIGAGVGSPDLNSWPIGRYVMSPTTTGGKPPGSSPDSRSSWPSPCGSETCFSWYSCNSTFFEFVWLACKFSCHKTALLCV